MQEDVLREIGHVETSLIKLIQDDTSRICLFTSFTRESKTEYSYAKSVGTLGAFSS